MELEPVVVRVRSWREAKRGLLEKRQQLAGRNLFFFGDVFGFPGCRGVVVKFQVSVAVLDEAEGIAANASGFTGVGDGVAIGHRARILEDGEEGVAVEEVGLFEVDEVAEGREEVDGFYDGFRTCAGLLDMGGDDDEGGAEGFLEEGVFSPDGVFAEVPAVVAPEDDEGVFGEAEFCEALDDAANLGVGVGDAGGVVAADFSGEFLVLAGILAPALVFHELTGAVPGGFTFGLGGVRDGGKFHVFVVREVFGRSAEGEVGAEDAGGEEEGLACFGEEVELVEGFIDGGAIGVDVIGAFESLEEVHVLGVFADFAIGKAVHPAARVLPFAGGEEVAVPGVGHFGLGVIIPVGAAAAAGVVGDFANGDGGVSVLAKVGGEGGVLDVFRAGEKGTISGGSVGAGEKGVAGGAAGGGLHVVAGEGAAARGEGVDVRRVDVVGAEALQFGAEVIDADEEDILFGKGAGG